MTRVVVTIAAALMPVAFLLLAFDLTSYGVAEPRYGDFMAWVWLSVLSVATSIVIWMLRALFGPLRFYCVSVGIAAVLLLLPLNPVSVIKVACVVNLLACVLEVASWRLLESSDKRSGK